MSWHTIQVLLVHELRMLLRDRRTVILAVALPLVAMPLFFLASRAMNERRRKNLEETIYKYAVTGSEREKLQALIARGQESLAQVPRSETGSKDTLANFRFVELQLPYPDASLKSKEIHFYLEALSGKEADALPRGTDNPAEGRRVGRQARLASEPPRLPGVPLIRIYHQGDRDASQAGRAKMRDFLIRVRRMERETMLQGRGFPVDPRNVMNIEDSNLASAGQVTGSALGRFLTVVLLMFMLNGGAIVAMDIIAGEKERGSLETLLTTAARRGEIVAAKQLAIMSVALVTTFIQVANILLYLTFKVIPLPDNFVIEAPPVTVLTLLLLFIPVAAFIAAVLLMLSAYAKSYKEAQLYFFPVYLVSLVPAAAAALPGIRLRSAIVVVPLANVSVAVREILVGKFDWPMILLTFVAMSAAAAGVVRASAKMLSKEKLITTSESDAVDFTGGPALFSRHVLRWYAVMGAILFSVAANIPELATFRRQLLFNELVLFLGAPLLMIWKYRLNFREALALRAVKPVVWLAVLLAIPSVNVVGIGVFRLADLVVPVPKQVLEQFGREVLPQDIPLWQLILFISVLPGICEEIAFRGTLLYGLRRRFHPAVLCVVIGVIFGLFHVTLFRIIPTGFLGIILTAIALVTGSIFPAMMAHAGSNAFALWASRKGLPLAALNWWVYVAAGVVFSLCFYILYRARSPYPGLRLDKA